MDKKTLIENIFREAHSKGSFNGAWLYAEKGEIVSKGAVGWRDPDNRLPLQEDSIFEMASVTKHFTAAAVMLLVREGKLSLDDELARYFPDFPYRGVTVSRLLNHTSGIPNHDVSALVRELTEKDNAIPDNGRFFRHVCERNDAPLAPPGEQYCYSDAGYSMLAETVEKVSGVRFEDFLKKNLFEPAGMKDSAVYHIRRDGIPSDRFARNMVLEKGSFVPSDLSVNSSAYVVGSDGLNGCDYLYTTVFDMLAWDRALREGTVLTPEEQQTMYTPGILNSGNLPLENGSEISYGFGWHISREQDLGLIVSHAGCMPGLSTWFERFVDADRVLIFMRCRDFTDEEAYSAFREGIEEIVRDRTPASCSSL